MEREGSSELSEENLFKNISGKDQELAINVLSGQDIDKPHPSFKGTTYNLPADKNLIVHDVLVEVLQKLNSGPIKGKSQTEPAMSALPYKAAKDATQDLTDVDNKPCLYADNQCFSSRAMKWGIVSPEMGVQESDESTADRARQIEQLRAKIEHPDLFPENIHVEEQSNSVPVTNYGQLSGLAIDPQEVFRYLHMFYSVAEDHNGKTKQASARPHAKQRKQIETTHTEARKASRAK